MRRKVAAVLATAAVLTGLGVAPAFAGTESGTLSCGTVSTASARGEQQHLVTMTIKINGSTYYQSSNAYVAYAYSNYKGTRSWSVNSDFILVSGSYGFCTPIEG